MSGPTYHAPTHRPKSAGGTDPVPAWLPIARMSNDANTQSVTTEAELEFVKNASQTNDDTVFRFDPSDPGGLLILEEGWYLAAATVNYQVADIAVPRHIYIMSAALSSGPLAALGVAFGEGGGFWLGTGQNETGTAEVTSAGPGKSNLGYMAISSIGVSENDPARMAVALIHEGTDYSVGGGIASGLTVTQISPYFGLPPKLPVPAP